MCGQVPGLISETNTDISAYLSDPYSPPLKCVCVRSGRHASTPLQIVLGIPRMSVVDYDRLAKALGAASHRVYDRRCRCRRRWVRHDEAERSGRKGFQMPKTTRGLPAYLAPS